jgi:hypothetical protein
MANQFLTLSLFIMLLAFFVVLNAMSTFDETKARPVMDSLFQAFTAREAVRDEQMDVLHPAFLETEGSTLDQLQGFFRSEVPEAQIRKNRLGTIMQVRVPLSYFEHELASRGDGQGTGFGGDFSQMLVSLMASSVKVPYSMAMQINMKDSPSRAQNETPEIVTANLKKVAGFAERIEAAGLPKNLVTAGLGQGPEGTIDFYFRRYEPFHHPDSVAPESGSATEEKAQENTEGGAQ